MVSNSDVHYLQHCHTDRIIAIENADSDSSVSKNMEIQAEKALKASGSGREIVLVGLRWVCRRPTKSSMRMKFLSCRAAAARSMPNAWIIGLRPARKRSKNMRGKNLPTSSLLMTSPQTLR